MFFTNLQNREIQEKIKQGCQGKSGVYQITNLENKKKYIASAATKQVKGNRLYIRFRYHFFHKSEKNKNYPLKRAIKKWGVSCFSWEILEWTNPEETTNRESWHLGETRPLYNILKKAGSSLGYKHTPFTREKMKTGWSAERRSLLGSRYKGKKRSPEARERMSQATRERTASQKENQKEKSGIWNRKKFSKKTKVFQGDDLSLLGCFPSLTSACDFFGGN